MTVFSVHVILNQFAGDEIKKQAVTRAVSRRLQYPPCWYAEAGSYHGGAAVFAWSHPCTGLYRDSGLGCQSTSSCCGYQG